MVITHDELLGLETSLRVLAGSYDVAAKRETKRGDVAHFKTKKGDDEESLWYEYEGLEKYDCNVEDAKGVCVAVAYMEQKEGDVA
ncbi:hypothetical protein Tco_0065822 [Tanacetum coccineum]